MSQAPAIDISRTAESFADAFRKQGEPERARGQKAYLKSDGDFFGVRVPFIRAQARSFRRTHSDLTTGELRALVEALWATTYHDLRTLGIALLEAYVAQLSPEEMSWVESLLRRSSTWDHVDNLSTQVSGGIVTRYPETCTTLERWAADEYFWLRRAAMLSLLPELRAGRGDFELFSRFAGAMIEEKEFFIRKAIGWILREVAKKRPQLTYQFLTRQVNVVAGLTLREGVKYLPEEQRESLLQQYRARA